LAKNSHIIFVSKWETGELQSKQTKSFLGFDPTIENI